MSQSLPSCPVRPVQRSILNRLGDVLGFKLRNTVKVGNRTRHLQDAVMSARTESLLRHGAFQQTLAIGREFAEFANQLRRHLGVAINSFASRRKAFQLDVSGAYHALQGTR